LESDYSRENARYRQIAVHALSLWFNEGRAAKQRQTANDVKQVTTKTTGATNTSKRPNDKTAPSDSRAGTEYPMLQGALESRRDDETRPWWLRAAVCQVWVEAARLRRYGGI
jgi:hypothetical protein